MLCDVTKHNPSVYDAMFPGMECVCRSTTKCTGEENQGAGVSLSSVLFSSSNATRFRRTPRGSARPAKHWRKDILALRCSCPTIAPELLKRRHVRSPASHGSKRTTGSVQAQGPIKIRDCQTWLGATGLGCKIRVLVFRLFLFKEFVFIPKESKHVTRAGYRRP